VEDEGIAAMLKTPENIRTLQRKLYRKAKQEPAFRFYALYDKVYRADILAHAYRLVCANKGGAGVDGITFEAIESGEGVTAFLAELEEALSSKCRRQRAGKGRMPCGEEHRKAVCGKTACTV
jgi:RNA-directed DNA polymerase